MLKNYKELKAWQKEGLMD